MTYKNKKIQIRIRVKKLISYFFLIKENKKNKTPNIITKRETILRGIKKFKKFDNKKSEKKPKIKSLLYVTVCSL